MTRCNKFVWNQRRVIKCLVWRRPSFLLPLPVQNDLGRWPRHASVLWYAWTTRFHFWIYFKNVGVLANLRPTTAIYIGTHAPAFHQCLLKVRCNSSVALCFGQNRFSGLHYWRKSSTVVPKICTIITVYTSTNNHVFHQETGYVMFSQKTVRNFRKPAATMNSSKYYRLQVCKRQQNCSVLKQIFCKICLHLEANIFAKKVCKKKFRNKNELLWRRRFCIIFLHLSITEKPELSKHQILPKLLIRLLILW